MNPLIIETQHGLGDNIYHRGFVKNLSKLYEVYLKTPFPEIYEDLPVKFIRQQSSLRTQSKNIAKSTYKYVDAPPNAPLIVPRYSAYQLERGSMMDGLRAMYHCDAEDFDLPKYKTIKIDTDKPICVVRPATVRKEWDATGRNAHPKYIHDAVERIRNDYYVVSVADLLDGEEYALNPLPYADLTLHKGELSTKELLGLIQKAELVIGGVGFIVPACIASKTKLFCILGGTGAYNAPEKITSHNMDLSNIFFAKPDNFCLCSSPQHNCDKTISNFKEILNGFIGNN